MKRRYCDKGRTAALVRRSAREQRRGMRLKPEAALFRVLLEVRAQYAFTEPEWGLRYHVYLRGLHAAILGEIKRRRLQGRLREIEAGLAAHDRGAAEVRSIVDRLRGGRP